MFQKITALMLLVCLCAVLVACGDGGTLNTATTDFNTGSWGSTSDGTSTVSTTDSSADSTTDSVTDESSESKKTSSTGKKPTTSNSGTSNAGSSSEKTSREEQAQAILESGSYLVGLTDQLNKRLVVCDLAEEDWSDDKAVVWEMSTYAGVAGIKFRDNDYWGQKVVIYCSGTKATIASYETKEVLLNITKAPGNSHSVELLPNGVFVVAGSTGSEIRVFGAGKKTVSDTVAFPDAHGVLWDPTYNVLWAVGSNHLQAFRVTGTATAPKLEAVKEMSYYPNQSLHDLSADYGNPDQLLLTGSYGVVLFNKKTGKTSYDYPAGKYLKTQTYVPGVGQFASGVCVFTTVRKDTLTYKEWGTDQVGVFVPLGESSGLVLMRQAKKDAYYKARLFSFDYQ